MSLLIVTPDRNTPGRKDFSGAFLPESLAFAVRANVHSVDRDEIRTVRIDLGGSGAARRAQLITAIAECERPLELVAFFCHGLMRKLPQLGWDTGNVAELATALAARMPIGARVVLYACSTAAGSGTGGDNGFADRLRDALCAAGAIDCQVDAHFGAGHATMNPRVRRFEGRGSHTGGVGGAWIVPPGSPKWRAWIAKLKTPYRFDFPFLPLASIHAAL
jgi:hypothetical protein